MFNSSHTPKELAAYVFEKLQNIRSTYTRPPNDVLTEIFEVLFYTSLKTEEGQFAKVTVTVIDPEKPDPNPPEIKPTDRWKAVRFEQTIPFSIKNLVKLCKAADPWSSSLAVFYNKEGEVFIWGMVDQAIHYQSYLNHEEEDGPEQPGLFQVSITGIGSLVVIMDYQLIASLKQNLMSSNFLDVLRTGVVAEKIKSLSLPLISELKDYVNKKYPSEDFEDWLSYLERFAANSILRILLRVQNYQHGGALLITSSDYKEIDIKYRIEYTRLKESLSNQLKHTISYGIYNNKIFTEYLEKSVDNLPARFYLRETVYNHKKNEARNEVKGAIRFIASLSCVDGLVLMNTDLTIVGFGCVVSAIELPKHIYISKSTLIKPSELVAVNPNTYGTRHRSMFSFCWKNPGSLGFVISQDGDVRAIMRVSEKLIVWENIKIQKFSRSQKLKKVAVK